MVKSTWKTRLVDHLVSEIFSLEKERIYKTHNDLFNKFIELGKSQSCYYQRFSKSLQMKIYTFAGRHPSLTPSIIQFENDLATLELDADLIRQGLVLALTDCSTPQDVFDAMPNVLHSALESLGVNYEGFGNFHTPKLQRTRPEGWNLIDKPNTYRQYLELREKIEFYEAYKLLY